MFLRARRELLSTIYALQEENLSRHLEIVAMVGNPNPAATPLSIQQTFEFLTKSAKHPALGQVNRVLGQPEFHGHGAGGSIVDNTLPEGLPGGCLELDLHQF